MPALLMVLVWAAQLDRPPEFSRPGGFAKSEVDAAIDSAAHTSGQKSESAKWMVRSLDQWNAPGPRLENDAWTQARRTLSTGALAAAASEFARGARQFSDSPRFHAGHAASVHAQGHYAKAAGILLAAAKRFPDELRFIPYLSEVADADPGVLPQLAAYAKAHPGSANAQYAYGAAVPGIGERYLLAAAKLDPRDPRPHVALGKLHQEDPKKAIAHLLVAVELDPQNAQAHYLLAQAYQRGNNRPKAAEHFERYKALKR